MKSDWRGGQFIPQGSLSAVWFYHPLALNPAGSPAPFAPLQTPWQRDLDIQKWCRLHTHTQTHTKMENIDNSIASVVVTPAVTLRYRGAGDHSLLERHGLMAETGVMKKAPPLGGMTQCAVLCCAVLCCAVLRCAAQLSLHRHTQCPSVGPQPWERCFGKPACVILWLQPANVTEESRQGRNAKQRLS